MNWFKRAELSKGKYPQKFVDWAWRVLAINPNTGETKKFPKKERKDTGECAHSMDAHCDGGDDGW
jgi:hypothetical protein